MEAKKKKRLPVDNTDAMHEHEDNVTPPVTTPETPTVTPETPSETHPAPTTDAKEADIATPTPEENTDHTPATAPLAEDTQTAKEDDILSETVEQQAEPDKSIPTPQEMIERIATSQHFSDNEREQMTTLLASLLDETAKGEIGETTLRHLARAVNYERDVMQAAREGEIKGRNMKIEEYLIERRNAEEIRQLGSNAVPSRPAPPASVIGGLSAADRKSIWERGHEKRVCHH